MSEKKTCFVVTPIGSSDSVIRRHIDGVIESAIKPVLEKFSYNMKVAHKLDDPGSINKQVFKLLSNSELVIANLTELNPNVMYELAVRHALRKPVIIISEKETSLPFDITDQRTIFYIYDPMGMIELKNNLDKTILSIEEIVKEDQKIDNPIYHALELENIISVTQNDSKEFNYGILFEEILDAISSLKNDIKILKKNEFNSFEKTNLSPYSDFNKMSSNEMSKKLINELEKKVNLMENLSKE